MENSTNSMNKCSICSDQRTSESPEESDWTMYFEDFSVKNSREQYTYCSSGFETSSLVFDAANSLAGKRFDRSERGGSFSMAKSSKRSSFKKRKTNGALVDHDALEDTATSPLNSTTPEEKAVRFSGKLDERSTEVVGFVERDYCDCAGLKKRGLSLVPLSRIMNYFG
ncbi:hypothetical protein I3843_12G126400 [Carya illinoinensis]|uniref:Uncharacterized protein n=1 Tax=Carya illinoinensis TaxID=32201 RepID=A0A8T1NZ31_CARIL|nr:vascular-related unknown protein 4 [Carya illinoinensis]KAG2678018.1 hypothetical protein I3760_12G124100 [Carya illinoinensis]KAG6634572.1 hypothetical protein CIPAW_12G127500 [Carya illinoinensis]KAG6685718.1 hypothetical protein I3842_12G126200 [Carya illinoinensis]KAG7953766.1 hypothetical protein I3843_12G126400 [Carya illinoinensis]